MGVTAELVDAIGTGLKNALERENKVRASKRQDAIEIKKFISSSGDEGPALYKRLVDLWEKGRADKGGITDGDKNNFCRFLRDHGGADEAASIERTYRYKYKPALLFIGGGRKNRNNKKEIEKLFADGEFRPSDLRSDERRQELLKRLVQLPLRAGEIDESLHNLHLLLVLGEHAEDFGSVGAFKREILADILVVGRHALYRVGLDDEELKLAKEIEKLARDGDNTAWLSARLQANYLGFVHSQDMRSDGALAALKLFRKNKDISLAGFGKGRIFAYIAESFIHRGYAVDAAPAELGMSIRAAIEESHDAARANGDFDGAIRVRTVLARGYLWQEQWEKALQVTKDIWEEYRALERDLPQAEMRLRYKEYIIHLLAEKRGERNASEYASMALNGALAASMRGGNTPILSKNHKLEFNSLGERLGIKIDTGN